MPTSFALWYKFKSFASDLIDILNSVYDEYLLVPLTNLTSRTKKFSNDNKLYDSFVNKKAKYTSITPVQFMLGGTARYTAPKLPDLPAPADNFSDNSDPENEFNWDKIKNNPDSWSQYQQDCQDQTSKGQTFDLVEIVSRIKEDDRLIKLAESAGKNQAIQDEINLMIEKLRLGNEQCGIGRRTLFRNVKELRGKEGGRVYYRRADGKIEILGKSNKVKREQQKVINILENLY